MKENDFIDIPGYEELYKINILGEIQSYPRKGTDGRILKDRINKRFGYKLINLYKNNKSKTYRVSRLVAITFILNPNNLPEVNHKDGNKQNNKVNNLEWVTASENMYHAYKTKIRIVSKKQKEASAINAKKNGLKYGHQNGIKNRRLSFNDAEKIRIYNKIKKHTQTELSELFGVSRRCINFIINNKTYQEAI